MGVLATVFPQLAMEGDDLVIEAAALASLSGLASSLAPEEGSKRTLMGHLARVCCQSHPDWSPREQ